DKMSTGRIWRFAELWTQLGGASHLAQLSVGFGCNFRVQDENKTPQYPVIDVSMVPKRFTYPSAASIVDEDSEKGNNLIEYIAPMECIE
ncbi:hypothetical protein ACKI1Z_42110, partial [Streptomyces galilaeus]|uniref:hypothetical protein n=1 Tax=Streptomyces galilaeus TaxID=33899 RepID=UPI0038F70193